MTSAITFERSTLDRVVAIANGKGGVGKTSTTVHLAANLAASGQKILVVDLDPQGNTNTDLGYENTDRGGGLVGAIMLRQPPRILPDVRPGLDVIPGGPELFALVDHLQSKRMRRRDGEPNPLLALAAALAPVAPAYDLVLLDCPPANSDVLQDAAMEAAHYLVIPTKADRASREGLVEMARRVAQVRAGTNAGLTLAGVLLFGVSSGAKSVQRAAREWVEAALGGHAPVFPEFIRYVESVAFDGREEGKLAHELPGGNKLRGVGNDYRVFTRAFVTRIAELERAAA